MFGLDKLKQQLGITETDVDCPVKGCSESVPRMRRTDKGLDQEKFQCPAHKIFISPSTFEYADKIQNILWHDSEDLAMLAAFKDHKRENDRLGRDNSEDAVTWNIFRHLERSGYLGPILSTWCGHPVKDPELIYWSYSQKAKSAWGELERARSAFGEKEGRGSEPDLIISCSDAVFWIEVKLGSTNDTSPSSPNSRHGYLSGGDNWFNRVFTSGYDTVAVEMKRYELMRLWLLGSWAAANVGKRFYLVNLLANHAVETEFPRHISQTENAKFLPVCWEDHVYQYLTNLPIKIADTNLVIAYMENKSAGYSNGKLSSAFDIPRR